MASDSPPRSVRFARLSRLRVMLGAPPDEVERPSNASKVVEDDEWMVIDVVLNWVGSRRNDGSSNLD